MAKKLPEVDVVVIGMGWTGGILSKELAETGLKVVALERGEHRAPAEDFSVPHIRDELNFSTRHGLMIDTRRDTLTVRNNIKETALPMRRLGSFLRATAWAGPVRTGTATPGAGPTMSSRSARCMNRNTARNSSPPT